MAESKRGEDESVRVLKVDVPAELKVQLKVEAAALDIPLRRYVQQILEDRIPATTRQKVEERARSLGMTYREFMLDLLKRTGVAE